ncbi:MAG: hypothetical protein C4527_25040 [Candidatus Omnitrophota bacterium]|jgi:hypothetical protein|nr:MAG: hypothetical protein C4527_25040 [Candidatus Omnitrophota bacterium]
MRQRIKRWIRFGFILCLFFLFSGVFVFALSIAPIWGDAVLCIEVRSHHGDQVDVSVPLSLVGTVFNVMPKELRQLCKDMNVTPASITDELAKMRGKDLVRVTSKDENVRVYIGEGMTAQGFVKVHVREGGRHGHNIHVWIPRGLISFSGQVINLLGIVDKHVELPPEISHLRVVKGSEITQS